MTCQGLFGGVEVGSKERCGEMGRLYYNSYGSGTEMGGEC